MNTFKIIEYSYLGIDIGPDEDSECVIQSNEIIYWDRPEIQPNQQEITDMWNTQGFQDWFAEHGGDPVITLRRKAKDAVSAQQANDLRFRAGMIEFVKEFNRHANKINSILDAVDASTSLADFKARVDAISDFPQRSTAQLMTLVEAALDNGEADS